MSQTDHLLKLVSENLTTSLLGGFLILVCYVIASRSSSKLNSNKYSFPPGPKRIPILGNLTNLKDGEVFLSSQVPIFGDVFTVYMASFPVVAVNSYNSIKDLCSRGNLMSERAPVPVLNDYFKGRGLAGAHHPGGFWEPQRKFVMNALRRVAGGGLKKLEQNLQQEIQSMVSSIRNKPPEDSKSVLELIQHSIGNFLCATLTGERFVNRARTMAQLIDEAMSNVRYVAASLVIPWLAYIPGNGIKKFFQCLDKLLVVGDELTSKVREKLGHSKDDNFIALFLEEMETYEKAGETVQRRESEEYHKSCPEFLNKDNLRYVIADFALASIETMTISVAWFILYMLRNPDMQRRAYEEVSSVLNGEDRNIEIADMKNLPYLQAVMMETWRLSAIAPLISRANTEDFEYKGHLIPANTWFFFNYYHLSRDPLVFEHPEEFNPSRFLGEDESYKPKEQFTPFGFGRRNCVGEFIARKQIFLIFSNLIKEFEFLPYDSKDLPTTDAVSGSIRKPKPYNLKIVSRKGGESAPCPVQTFESHDLNSKKERQKDDFFIEGKLLNGMVL